MDRLLMKRGQQQCLKEQKTAWDWQTADYLDEGPKDIAELWWVPGGMR